MEIKIVKSIISNHHFNINLKILIGEFFLYYDNYNKYFKTLKQHLYSFKKKFFLKLIKIK